MIYDKSNEFEIIFYQDTLSVLIIVIIQFKKIQKIRIRYLNKYYDVIFQ